MLQCNVQLQSCNREATSVHARNAQRHYYKLSKERVRAVKALAGSSAPPWSAASSPTPQTWAKSTETPAGTGTPTVGATAPDEPSCGSGQPCPPWSTCVSWAGHFSCRCVLGFYLSRTMGCVPARTFPGRLSLRATGPAPPSPLPPADLRRVVTQLESLFQPILGQLDAYLSSSVLDLQPHSQAVTVLHSFSALSSVTARQVDGAIAGFWERCQASDPACSFLRDTVSYQSLSLCELQPCDPVSTACVFQDGLAQCPCRPGYHPVPANGHACAACGSGFWLRDGICASLPAGAGWGVLRWGRRPAAADGAAAPGESQGTGTGPQPGRAGRAALPAPAAEPAPGAPSTAPGGGGDPGAWPRGQAEPGCWAGAGRRAPHEDVPGLPELAQLSSPARGWPEQPGVCQ
ncbi:protein HEG homolog 1-like isoform X2 [Gopherus evgoodei]|uniref:protein HEG homolog 1-like isoform X2 n=1 Tax=Gopherus evgoodei TaxID=1825980 RepID=UPI0011CF852F|nr:protein HEG homolog 1-like isoform X2 [Gopherus evgoodei]